MNKQIQSQFLKLISLYFKRFMIIYLILKYDIYFNIFIYYYFLNKLN